MKRHRVFDRITANELCKQQVPLEAIQEPSDLFQAIETSGQPSISGEDNLKTLPLVFGCYKAAQERRAVRPMEIS